VAAPGDPVCPRSRRDGCDRRTAAPAQEATATGFARRPACHSRRAPSRLSTTGLPCSGSSYVGVGVTADPRTERIILVGEDTPASRAGLQHDDIVLNPVVWRDSHQEGVLLRVEVLREGVTMTVPVRVGKICID
jgi:hypothetical protein